MHAFARVTCADATYRAYHQGHIETIIDQTATSWSWLASVLRNAFKLFFFRTPGRCACTQRSRLFCVSNARERGKQNKHMTLFISYIVLFCNILRLSRRRKPNQITMISKLQTTNCVHFLFNIQ